MPVAPLHPAPPIPPRRSSPTLVTSNQLTVPKEDAPPLPSNHSLPTESELLHNGVSEPRYNCLEGGPPKMIGPSCRVQSCPSLGLLPSSAIITQSAISGGVMPMAPTKSQTTPHFPASTSSSGMGGSTSSTSESLVSPPLPPPPPPPHPHPLQLLLPQVIHYAELANITEEPSYENTIILPGHITMVKPVYSATPPCVELPTVSTLPHVVKSPLPDTKFGCLDGGGCLRATPSRGSSIESNASTTSSGGGGSMAAGLRSLSPEPSPSSTSHPHQLHAAAVSAAMAAASTPPYENINMDYIAKLTSEGYAQEAVIRALGITRNDIAMACDILHEFGTKQSL
ncbi:hypothetical protein AAG570_001660 [Ranatra chinensis]|uniref:UBA domain-containing protein n=1 Tax=Ranatra chinensis TaxID=642074 RepID=A0ABD0Y980_9HEMI